MAPIMTVAFAVGFGLVFSMGRRSNPSPSGDEAQTDPPEQSSVSDDREADNAFDPSVDPFDLAHGPLTYTRIRLARQILPDAEYQRQRIEAFENASVSQLLRIAQEMRDHARKRQTETAGLFPELMARAPWAAVEGLIADLEWERATMGDDNIDLDQEGSAIRALIKLGDENRERAAGVMQSVRHAAVLQHMRFWLRRSDRPWLVEAALRSKAALGDEELRSQLHSDRVVTLAAAEPDRVDAEFAELPDQESRDAAARAILTNFKDRELWSQRLLDLGAFSGEDDVAIAAEMLKWHRPLGIELAEALPDSNDKTQLIKKSMGHFVKNHPEVATELARLLPDGDAAIAKSRARAGVASTPEEFVDALSHNAIYEPLDRWMNERGDSGYAELAGELGNLPPTSRNARDVIFRFSGKWADSAPEAAMKWAISLQTPGFRSYAASAASSRLTRSDPQGALRLADTIDDSYIAEKLRKEARRAIESAK